MFSNTMLWLNIIFAVLNVVFFFITGSGVNLGVAITLAICIGIDLQMRKINKK